MVATLESLAPMPISMPMPSCAADVVVMLMLLLALKFLDPGGTATAC